MIEYNLFFPFLLLCGLLAFSLFILRLILHPELHPNAHSSQLDVQVAKNTGNRDHRNVISANEAFAVAILPDIGAGVLKDCFARTASAADDAGHAANGTDTRGGSGLVGSSVDGRSGGAGVAALVGADVSDGDLGGEERAARATDPGALSVRAVHQTVLKKECSAVGEEGVTLHLSDTDTTSLGTTLDGLAGDAVDGTGGTDLELVVHHVSQTLVVDDTQVDVRGEFATCDSTVHGLVSVVVVTCFAELVAEVVGRRVLFGELERCRVLGMTVQGAGLASHGLDHLGDCHTC